MKKNFKYTIIHPTEKYRKNTDFEEMQKIEVTLELCTIYKNKPFGPAIIIYTDCKNNDYSFKGAGVFNENGELKTFSAMDACGWGYLVNNMQHGRP